jgi:hypothetical protein
VILLHRNKATLAPRLGLFPFGLSFGQPRGNVQRRTSNAERSTTERAQARTTNALRAPLTGATFNAERPTRNVQPHAAEDKFEQEDEDEANLEPETWNLERAAAKPRSERRTTNALWGALDALCCFQTGRGLAGWAA